MTDPSREQRIAELDARAHNMRAAIPTRDEPTRYDRLSPLARALVDDYDEIDLAEMLVAAQDELARYRATIPAPVWTPPPPGDTREQLPTHLLALIEPAPYLSTACQTADLLALQATYSHPLHDEIRQYAERLHQRCRLNNKFTGQLCTCGCHPAEQTATPPAATEATDTRKEN